MNEILNLFFRSVYSFIIKMIRRLRGECWNEEMIKMNGRM